MVALLPKDTYLRFCIIRLKYMIDRATYGTLRNARRVRISLCCIIATIIRLHCAWYKYTNNLYLTTKMYTRRVSYSVKCLRPPVNSIILDIVNLTLTIDMLAQWVLLLLQLRYPVGKFFHWVAFGKLNLNGVYIFILLKYMIDFWTFNSDSYIQHGIA